MEIIKITQIGAFESQMQVKGEEIRERLAYVDTLVCDENSKSEVKKIRAEYNKESKEYKEAFKQALSVLEEPVNKLKALYKEHIDSPYSSADKSLKDKIDFIEKTQKEVKYDTLLAYFEEYKNANDNGLISFAEFSKCVPSITLSTSEKAYKKQICDYIDKIVAETNSIAMMEDKDIILLDYLNHLDLARAIANNNTRKERLAEQQRLLQEKEQRDEALKKQQEERELLLAQQQEERELLLAQQRALKPPVQEKVPIVEPEVIPMIEIPEPPKEKDPEEIITVRFEVSGKRKDVRKIGDFLKANNISYKFI